MQETKEMQIQSLGWEDPMDEEMATHSSILALEILWTEEPGRLWLIESQDDWSDLAPTVGSEQHTITKHTPISVAKHIHILINWNQDVDCINSSQIMFWH